MCISSPLSNLISRFLAGASVTALVNAYWFEFISYEDPVFCLVIFLIRGNAFFVESAASLTSFDKFYTHWKLQNSSGCSTLQWASDTHCFVTLHSLVSSRCCFGHYWVIFTHGRGKVVTFPASQEYWSKIWTLVGKSCVFSSLPHVLSFFPAL